MITTQLQEIGKMVKGSSEGDTYVFHCEHPLSTFFWTPWHLAVSGHALQLAKSKSKDRTEEDWMDEAIITTDGNIIDNVCISSALLTFLLKYLIMHLQELYIRLVEPLHRNSTLVVRNRIERGYKTRQLFY